MTLTRRQFLAASAAAGLPMGLPIARPGWATTPLGIGTLTTVSDGSLTLPGSFLFEGMPPEALAKILSAQGVSAEQVTPECNLALYRDDQHTVLFDVGAGADFMPSAGAVVDSLDALGLAPEDVTHVVFTHAHPDHIWGVLDDFDDPLFTEATYLMGRQEWDYWWNPATVDEIGEARAAFAVGAKRRMEAIEDQVAFFEDGEEILPGIAAMATFGHTPGHMAFEIGTGSERALVLGDAIGNHHVALARPEWESNSDQDPTTAVATRKRLLDRITAEQMHVVGFHLPDGGMGRIEAVADGYRFVAEG